MFTFKKYMTNESASIFLRRSLSSYMLFTEPLNDIILARGSCCLPGAETFWWMFGRKNDKTPMAVEQKEYIALETIFIFFKYYVTHPWDLSHKCKTPIDNGYPIEEQRCLLQTLHPAEQTSMLCTWPWLCNFTWFITL